MMAQQTLSWLNACTIATLLVLLVTPLRVVSRRIQERPGRRLKAMYPATCAKYLPSGMMGFESFSVILTADPGTFSGQAEARHFVYNLKSLMEKPANQTVCGSVYQGYLVGAPVIVATTGIGPGPAALCTQEIIHACGDVIKEVIYFGTSGWSPMLGGLLDPSSTNCTSASTETRIVRLGDVCVTPFSVNWNCKKTGWTDQAAGYPNECFRPSEIQGPSASFLYGDCEFYNMKKEHRDSDLQLAREIRAAGMMSVANGAMLARPQLVLDHERDYWQRVDEGAKLPNKTISASPPQFWKPVECLEVDSQFFYTGIPWEIKARDYAAEVINLALNLTGSKMATSRTVVAAAAMEGIGAGQALLKYDLLDSSAGRHIPFTNVRAASNWLHQPVSQTSPGVWEIYRTLEEDYVNGYAFAIATGSTTILQLLKTRCEKAGMNSCTFTLQPSS